MRACEGTAVAKSKWRKTPVINMRTAAERQRDYRARRKLGRRVIRLEVDIDQLVAVGLLQQWDDADDRAVKAALQKALRALRVTPGDKTA
jgi:hypothetical protein